MRANLFGLTLVVILTSQTCQSLETETSEERRAKCKCRVHRQWCFTHFFYIYIFLLSVLPIFQVIRFPVSIFINTTKKSRKFLIFWSFFRMMAAQVPIEMVHAIQGNFSTINDRFKNFKHIIFYFSAKNVPQKVEPKMALVLVDLASAVFVWINCSTFLTRGHLHIT